MDGKKWVRLTRTDGVEFCNGIDPGCFLDPTTGKFWLTFGSYFGNIRVVEMNPKTGLRIDPINTTQSQSIAKLQQ